MSSPVAGGSTSDSEADGGAPASEQAAEAAAVVQLVNASKRYSPDAPLALNDVTLSIGAGEFFSLLGPSGSGKTTSLRLIAGFEPPTSGTILLDGFDVTRVPPFKRDVNTVFQNYALFPHMTVEQNVSYPLRMRRVRRQDIGPRVAETLALVEMTGYERRLPHELSGGQRQRIALARALVGRPRVLLLDEPLGALDLQLRQQMQLALKHLQRDVGITFVYVTHDQGEALAMSDRLAVMANGRLEQVGTPVDVYERPATRFVAGFIGKTNLVPCTVSPAPNGVRVDAGPLALMLTEPHEAGSAVASIRCEAITLVAPDATGDDAPDAIGVVHEVVYLGDGRELIVDLGGQQLVARVSGSAAGRYVTGASVGVRVDVASVAIIRE